MVRNLAVDGLRGLTALYVVLFHAMACWTAPGAQQRSYPSGQFWYFNWMEYGHYAVSIFIVLSGFCLAQALVTHDWFKGGVAGYLCARARRIMPAYYAALIYGIVMVAVFYPHYTITLRDVVLRLFFMQDIQHTGCPINGALWSMDVEWRLYFVFIGLVFIWKRYGILAATITGMVMSVILVCLTSGTVYSLTWQFLGLFTLGMLAAVLSAWDGWWHRYSLPIAIVGAIAIVAVLWDRHGRIVWLDYIVGITACALLIHLSTGRGMVHRLLASPVPVLLGTISYSLYLVHMPITQALGITGITPNSYNNPWQTVLNLAIAVAVSLAAAMPFYLAFERPFLHTQTRTKDAPDARAKTNVTGCAAAAIK